MSDETDAAMAAMLNGDDKASTEEAKPEATNTQETAQENETDWKAEAKKWETRSKENFNEVNRLKPLETKVSELETELAETKKVAATVDTERVNATRWRVAAEYGVSKEDVELFMTATDEETLVKQAERLSTSAKTGPKPDPSQGKRKEAPTSKGDSFAGVLEGLFSN